jgi:ABC-2 type transport system ATP-binding protein
MISVRGLQKIYRVHRREPGLAAAVSSLVRRRYDDVRAVDGIDFEIGAGERVGFLGPNGAGKTTTLKMLAGLLHPTAGEARVDGHEPRKRDEAFLRKITLVLGQKQQLIWDLPPSETFELNRAIYGIPREAFDKTQRQIVELLEIGDVIKRPTRQLSLGERMKCELAAALIHGPKVLFLDEPTIGLDVSMQSIVRDFIRRYNEEHAATVILTSHNMADVTALCPRVILINHGKLAFDGELRELVHRTRPDKRVTFRFGKKVDRAALDALGAVVRADDESAELQVPASEVSQVVAKAIASMAVEDLNVTDPPLEEIMADIFTKASS